MPASTTPTRGNMPSKPLSLPLPPDFFKCPPLSPAEIAQYKARAEQSVRRLVEKATILGGPLAWSLMSQEGNLKLYKAETSNDERDLVCGVMDAVGTLEEVMRLYRMDSKAETNDYIRRFGRAYVDAAHLYKIMPPQPDRPNDSVNIKWALVKGPMDGLIARRDMCILESNMELQLHGKRAWVRAFTSVDLECVPDMRASLNAIRAHQYDMGHIFIESDRPGYLTMTNLADMNARGLLTDWAAAQAIKTWCRQLTDIDGFLREDRLSATPFLRPDQLCPLESRTRCRLCTKRFGHLRKKTPCVKCGEVLCGKCTKEWQVRWNGIPVLAVCCYPCSLRDPTTFSIIKGPRTAAAATPNGQRTYELATPMWGLEASLVGVSPRSSSGMQSGHEDGVFGWNTDDVAHHHLLHAEAPPFSTMRTHRSNSQVSQRSNSKSS